MKNKFVVTFEIEYEADVNSELVGKGFQKYFDILDSGKKLTLNPTRSSKTSVIKVTNAFTGESYVATKADEVVA